MTRYTVFLIAVLGTAATAIAAMAPANHEFPVTGPNVTVIEKNQAFPPMGPIAVESCLTEDCADIRI